MQEDEKEDGVTEIELGVNVKGMRCQFLRDAILHGVRIEKTGGAAEISRFRNFIVSLNISVQATCDTEDVLALREELHKLMIAVVERDEAMKKSRDLDSEGIIYHDRNEE